MQNIETTTASLSGLARPSSPAREVIVDFTDPAFIEDPYPHYAALRARGEIIHGIAGHSVQTAGLFVTSFAAANQILRSPNFETVHFRRGQSDENIYQGPQDLLGRFFLNAPKPEYQIVKQTIAEFYRPNAIQSQATFAQSLASEILRNLGGKEEFDAYRDFALPYAFRFAANFLGLPKEELPQFQSAAITLTTAAGTFTTQSDFKGAVLAGEILWQLIERHAESMTKASPVAAALCASDTISIQNKTANLIFLLVAGFVTTSQILASGIDVLSRSPEGYRELRENRQLIGSAIDELLRLEPPVHALKRNAIKAATISGFEIQEGESLLVLLGSANHDEKKYPEPDRFDPSRGAGSGLTFGAGSHFCLGAPLALLELKSAVSAFLDAITGVQPGTQAPIRAARNFRGFESLPVTAAWSNCAI